MTALLMTEVAVVDVLLVVQQIVTVTNVSAVVAEV
jgi:hypothetical protein